MGLTKNKLEITQGKDGRWRWAVVCIRGKTRHVRMSGPQKGYTTKYNAKQAFDNRPRDLEITI